MALDPALDIVQNADRDRNGQPADLNRRLTVQERARPTVQQGSGAPTSSPRDGTLYVDYTNLRLYVRANGVWRFCALT